jgi:hypothetical protein
MDSGFYLFLAALVVAIFVGAVVSCWDQKRSRRRFPPISDDEFLARCAPGTNPQVALKVRRIVADSLGVEYERIYPSSRFAEDLGAD